MAARPQPPASRPPVSVQPPDMADIARTLDLADSLLGSALASIDAHFVTNLKACDNSLQSCRDSISTQLDTAIKQGWQSHKDGSQIVQDNLAYLMSAAQQYAAQLGYPGTKLADPAYASPAEHIARQVDYLHTGTGDVDVSSWPSNLSVGVRAVDPAIQHALETSRPYQPHFLTLNSGVYALVGQAQPMPGEHTAAGGVVQRETTPLPSGVQTAGVTYPLAGQSPAAVSLIANIPQSTIAPISGLFETTTPTVALTPSGLSGLAAARVSAARGRIGPFVYDGLGGHNWIGPAVSAGDSIYFADGKIGVARECSGSEASSRVINSILCCDPIDATPTVSPSIAAIGATPSLAGTTPTLPETQASPWDCANCHQTPAPCPAPIIQVMPCSGPLSGLAGTMPDKPYVNLPVPVDMDQPRAFRFSPDDADWKAAALAWEGEWLSRWNSSTSLATYLREVQPDEYAATRSDD